MSRLALAFSLAAATSASASVIIPDRPPLAAVADRVHGFAVLVVSGPLDQPTSSVSGVLAGDGLVVTDLHAVAQGEPLEARPDLSVVVAGAHLTARLVGVAPDVDLAVLQLPTGARALPAPAFATAAAQGGDELLAVATRLESGSRLVFEVAGIALESVPGGPPRLNTPLPKSYTGAPIFDAQGSLAGLNVAASDSEGLVVSAARLQRLLDKVRSALAANPALPI